MSAAAAPVAGRPADRRSANVVFALLVIACFAAFFVTQRLKHTPTAVQAFKLTPFFSPTPSGHVREERISFKLAHADRVTVTIENAAGEDVATLLREHPVARYKQLSLRWNGRRGRAHGYRTITSPGGHVSLEAITTGAPAPAGEYRVRVALRHQHRSLRSPRSFTLVRR